MNKRSGTMMMAGASSLNQAQGDQPVDSNLIRIRTGLTEE